MHLQNHIQNIVMLKNSEDAYDGAYSVDFLYDSELLDLALGPLSITIDHLVPAH